ncbi:MAG: succinate dehydrogenase [Bacillota bacterium]
MATYSSSDGRSGPATRGFELYSWLFMRLSGVLLVFLALGHLVIMHVLNNVEAIDYNFVASRLAGPLGAVWRSYDLLLLALALLHGMNGLRGILHDAVRSPRWRAISISTVYALTGIFLALGALVLLSFQPQGVP